MEAESSGRPQSFEDATLALMQALNPERRLDKDKLPFKQIRRVFGDFVGKNRQHLATSTGSESPVTASENFRILGPEERNGCNNLEISDDSSSQVSMDDSSVSHSRSLTRVQSLDRIAVKNSAFKLPKHSRKMTYIRTRRREALRIKDFLKLDFSEDELAKRFSQLCREELARRSNSVEVFHLVLNSLNNYFHHRTWLENVEGLVQEFLEFHFLKKCAELGSNEESGCKCASSENRLREYELMVLVELYLLQFGKQSCDISETDIVNKLQCVYISGGAVRMRKFLDEPVADLYAHVLPKLLVQIYEELCVSLPSDLIKFANGEGSTQEMDTPGKSTPIGSRKSSKAENLNRLLKEDSEADDLPSTSSVSIKNRRHTIETKGPRRPRRSLFINGNGGPSEMKKDSRQLHSRRFVVPETPEAKVKSRKRKYRSESDEREPRKTIKQTPMAKMKKTSVSSRKSSKYSLLLRKTNSRGHLNSTQSDNVELSSPVSPTRRFSVRTQTRNSFLPSPPQGSSLSNGSSHSNSGRKLSLSFNERLAHYARPRSSDNSNFSSHPQQEKPKDDFVLEKAIVDRYRKRLEFVRHSQRKADKNEVFYGRSAKRNNLYEENPSEEMTTGITTRSSVCLTVQKNRSGRSVDSNRVHLAHALLNVHNSEPLTPSKAPKTSPFKLNRMVRPATKSDRKKLEKLKLRMHRSHGTCTIVSSAEDSPVNEKPSSSTSSVDA